MDKIDINGPNIAIKELVKYFKKKYNVDIDSINYCKKIIAFPMEGNENMDNIIEKLIEEKTVKKINNRVKYIKLDLIGSFNDNDNNTPIKKSVNLIYYLEMIKLKQDFSNFVLSSVCNKSTILLSPESTNEEEFIKHNFHILNE